MRKRGWAWESPKMAMAFNKKTEQTFLFKILYSLKLAIDKILRPSNDYRNFDI